MEAGRRPVLPQVGMVPVTAAILRNECKGPADHFPLWSPGDSGGGGVGASCLSTVAAAVGSSCISPSVTNVTSVAAQPPMLGMH